MKMKRSILPLSFFVLSFLLSSCIIDFSLTGLDVYGFTYSTNFSSPNTSNVICNNSTTSLIYSFKVDGGVPLSWTSQLRGKETNIVNPDSIVRFFPSSAGVSLIGTNTYRVEYLILPGAAPKRTDADGMSSQAITVEPTGASVLELTVTGPDGRVYNLSNPPEVPVVENCASNFEAYDFDYQTSYVSRTTGKYVICNDRTTNLTYGLKVRGGEATALESRLRGKTTGDIKGQVYLRPGIDPQVKLVGSNGYEVNYQINAGGTPKREGIETTNITTQAINVTPVNPGATILELTVYGGSKRLVLTNPPEITVADSCTF